MIALSSTQLSPRARGQAQKQIKTTRKQKSGENKTAALFAACSAMVRPCPPGVGYARAARAWAASAVDSWRSSAARGSGCRPGPGPALASAFHRGTPSHTGTNSLRNAGNTGPGRPDRASDRHRHQAAVTASATAVLAKFIMKPPDAKLRAALLISREEKSGRTAAKSG